MLLLVACGDGTIADSPSAQIKLDDMLTIDPTSSHISSLDTELDRSFAASVQNHVINNWSRWGIWVKELVSAI